MPELPEVEAVTRKLQAEATGARISGGFFPRPVVIQPHTAAQLHKAVVGRSIDRFERRGKNILAHLDNGTFLRVHLRMTGNFLVIPDARLRPVTARAAFELDDGRAVVLDDPRALGRITLHKESERDALFADLGPEPFSPEFTPEAFIASAHRSAKPIKILLMDQRAVTGLGNIYAAESLFQAGIHPARESRGISRPRLRELHRIIVEVLTVAIDSAVVAYSTPGGFSEGEFFPVAVYGREGEPCPRCGAKIRRITQGGRSTYYCPRCQR